MNAEAIHGRIRLNMHLVQRTQTMSATLAKQAIPDTHRAVTHFSCSDWFVRSFVPFMHAAYEKKERKRAGNKQESLMRMLYCRERERSFCLPSTMGVWLHAPLLSPSPLCRRPARLLGPTCSIFFEVNCCRCCCEVKQRRQQPSKRSVLQTIRYFARALLPHFSLRVWVGAYLVAFPLRGSILPAWVFGSSVSYCES